MPLHKLQPIATAPANFWAFFLLLLVFLLLFSFFTAASGGPVRSQGPIVYSRDQLLVLDNSVVAPQETRCPSQAEEDSRMPCRSCLPGQDRPVLPSAVMGNVRSLLNKMYELMVLTWQQRDYRECNIMVFTVKWLNNSHSKHRSSSGWFQRAVRG